MSLHEDSMKLLKKIYDECNHNQSFNILKKDYDSYSPQDRHDLNSKLQYLSESGFIKNHTPCVGLPISVRITPEGIRTIENIKSTLTPHSANVTNIYGNNYGIIGSNNSANSISNSFSFQDIQRIIHESTASDEEKKLLEEALKPLYDRIQINAPLEKGVLSSVEGKIQKYQTLLSAVIQSVVSFLTASK